MAGADLPLELLPVKLQQKKPSRKEVELLGAVINFQLGFELIGQPVAPANKTDSFPALQRRGNGYARVGDHGPGRPRL